MKIGTLAHHFWASAAVLSRTPCVAGNAAVQDQRGLPQRTPGRPKATDRQAAIVITAQKREEASSTFRSR